MGRSRLLQQMLLLQGQRVIIDAHAEISRGTKAQEKTETI